jgi:hypothetical protein
VIRRDVSGCQRRGKFNEYLYGGYFLAKVARDYRESDCLPDGIGPVSDCFVETLSVPHSREKCAPLNYENDRWGPAQLQLPAPPCGRKKMESDAPTDQHLGRWRTCRECISSLLRGKEFALSRCPHPSTSSRSLQLLRPNRIRLEYMTYAACLSE